MTGGYCLKSYVTCKYPFTISYHIIYLVIIVILNTSFMDYLSKSNYCKIENI